MSSREEDFLSQPEIQRRWIRKLTTGVVILAVFSGFNLIHNIYNTLSVPKPLLLGLDNQLRVRQLTISSEYRANEKEVMSWMVVCAMDATSFSFDKYQREADRARQCFEPSAWKEYFSKLEAADFNRVRNRRTNVSGAPAGFPSFVREHVVDGVKAKEFVFPFVRTWENAKGKEHQSHIARVIIQPVDNAVKPSGWQIIHFSLGAAS